MITHTTSYRLFPAQEHNLAEESLNNDPNSTSTLPRRVKILNDLPTEVVFVVFEFLPDEDLYRLAFACRYLHHLALPAYLSRFGSSPNSGEFIFDNIMSVDALKALNSALYRPRLNRLVYTYDLGQMLVTSAQGSSTTTSAAEAVLREVANPEANAAAAAAVVVDAHPSANLRRLLDIVDIDDVHLQLGDLALKSRAEDHLSARAGQQQWPAADDVSQDDRLMQAIQRSGKSWVDILNEFLYKAKCRHLTVELVSHQRTATVETIEGSILQNYYGFNSVFAGGRRYASRAVEGASRWIGLRTPVLEKLQIHSEALFHPLLLQWTIRTLSLSTMTSVTFDQLHHLSPETWSLLLPCIAIPNLLHLSISLCAIHTPDLHQFLARHPSIQELRLGANLPPPLLNGGAGGSMPNIKRGKNVFLPSLRKLAGPPEHLVAFLSSPMHPLPTIETVHVTYRARRASQFTLNAINHDLAPICLRLRNVKEVVLSVSFETSGVDWVVAGSPLEAPVGGQQQQQQSYTFGQRGRSMGASGSRSSTTERLFPRTTSSTSLSHRGGEEGGVGPPGGPPSVSFITSCVTKLEFNANVYVLPLSIVYSLPKWFAEFSKLRVLSMRTLASGPNGSSSPLRRAAGQREEAFELPSHKTAFLLGVSRHCPSVKRVEVDGQEEELPAPGRVIARLP